MQRGCDSKCRATYRCSERDMLCTCTAQSGTLEQSNTLSAPLTIMRYRKYRARMHTPQYASCMVLNRSRPSSLEEQAEAGA